MYVMYKSKSSRKKLGHEKEIQNPYSQSKDLNTVTFQPTKSS